jgi:hypothetical protein
MLENHAVNAYHRLSSLSIHTRASAPGQSLLGPQETPRLPRQNTRIESEGAEFLVLGQLLIAGIPSYKSYTNMPGYDLVATNPEANSSARISVKSRWKTKAEGFIIKNFDCDFVVIAKLNRGTKDGRGEVLPPEFFVLPVEVLRAVPRTGDWGKVAFAQIPDLEQYRDRWNLICDFLDNAVLAATVSTVPNPALHGAHRKRRAPEL